MTHPATGNPIWANDRVGGTPILAERLNNVEELLDILVQVTPEQFGAVGDGVTDDSTAIQAAVNSSAYSVKFADKVYAISTVIQVGNETMLVGEGGLGNTDTTRGTTFKCLDATSGLWFYGDGGGAKDIRVNGNGVALQGIKIGGVLTDPVLYPFPLPGAGADKFFMNVGTTGCLAGFLIQGTQNSILSNCRANLATSGAALKIDASAGGLYIERFEGNSSTGTACLVLSQSASGGNYTQPTQIHFDTCIFEARTDAGPLVSITAADAVLFTNCGFAESALHSGDTSGLVEMSSLAYRVEFTSCQYFAITTTRKAIRNAAASGFVILNGHNSFSAASGGPTTGMLDIPVGICLQYGYCDWNGASGFLRSAATPANSIVNFMYQTPLQVQRNLAAEDALRVHVGSEANPRLDITAGGIIQLGAGGASAVDTFISRTTGIPGEVGVGTQVTSKRYLAPALFPSVAANTSAGVLTIDLSASAKQYFLMGTTSVTDFNFLNRTDGQLEVELLFFKTSTGNLTLPNFASTSIGWDGGDANKPVLTTAGGWLSITLVPYSSTEWREKARAGTDVARIPLSQKGVSGGVATLTSDVKITPSQLGAVTRINASGSYTVPVGVTQLEIIAVGGGGGGGGGGSATTSGGITNKTGAGGGGAGQAVADIVACTAGDVLTVTIGAGGTGGNGGAANNNPGTVGNQGTATSVSGASIATITGYGGGYGAQSLGNSAATALGGTPGAAYVFNGVSVVNGPGYGGSSVSNAPGSITYPAGGALGYMASGGAAGGTAGATLGGAGGAGGTRYGNPSNVIAASGSAAGTVGGNGAANTGAGGGGGGGGSLGGAGGAGGTGGSGYVIIKVVG